MARVRIRIRVTVSIGIRVRVSVGVRVRVRDGVRVEVRLRVRVRVDQGYPLHSFARDCPGFEPVVYRLRVIFRGKVRVSRQCRILRVNLGVRWPLRRSSAHLLSGCLCSFRLGLVERFRFLHLRAELPCPGPWTPCCCHPAASCVILRCVFSFFLV